MDEIDVRAKPLTFNGPIEAGLRAVALLGAAFPGCYDLQRQTALDYLLVNTGQLGGPEDLHPSSPIRTPATEVRRKIILDALHLMMTRELVVRRTAEDGIHYCAGEATAMFLDSLRTPYICRLKERANWLVHHLAAYSDKDFYELMHQFFDNWVIEFQHAEQSLGVDS